MGMTQILMIVLAVIVVGAAVAVGIEMFDRQATSQARAAVTAELLYMASQCQAYFRLPRMMMNDATNNSIWDAVRYIEPNINFVKSPGEAVINTANGEYYFSLEVGPGNGNPDGSDWVMGIRGISSAKKSVEIKIGVSIWGGEPPDYGISFL